MLGLKNSEVHNSGDGWSPVYVTPDGNEQDVDDDLESNENNNNMEMDGGMVAVISVGFMLPDNDSAVIWRGPRKNALIKQFLTVSKRCIYRYTMETIYIQLYTQFNYIVVLYNVENHTIIYNFFFLTHSKPKYTHKNIIYIHTGC